MPRQPKEGGRNLERRAFDDRDPETRIETAGHAATRRKVLSMVTGGIAATAAVGTAAASKRPTVYAGSETCGVVDLDYTRRGPTVAVEVIGERPEHSYTRTLEPGGSESVTVPAGDYDVHARPARANGGSSVPVVGAPVPVEQCGEVTATLTDCLSMAFGIELKNEGASCVHLEIVTKDGGSVVDEDPIDLGPGDTVSRMPWFSGGDEWIFGAYMPPPSGDCSNKGEDVVPINGVDSALRLTGSDCSSLTVVEGSLEGV